MFSLFFDFSLSAIIDFQNRRVREIYKTFDLSSDEETDHAFDTPLNYALSHQILERAIFAANTSNHAEFDWCISVLKKTVRIPTLNTLIGSVIVSQFDETFPASKQFSEMPAAPLSSSTTGQVSTHICQVIQQSISYAHEAGFCNLLKFGCRIVTPLKMRQINESASSWTTTSLPNTVFLDYHNYAALTARDLIHEAGHNWLNDCLFAYSEKLPSEVKFYSPWKCCKRPVFSFIHSLLAFSLVVNYCRWASYDKRLDKLERDFLVAVVLSEQDRLFNIKNDVPIALTYLANPDLKDSLLFLFEDALKS